MNEAQKVTPARESHWRALAAISTELHNNKTGLGDLIKIRQTERRHAEDNTRELQKEVEHLEREMRFASASALKSLRERQARATAALESEKSRDHSLRTEINALTQQKESAALAQQCCGNLVDKILKGFGSAGQDVGRRIRGTA